MPDIDVVITALKDSIRNQHCGFIEGVGNVYAVSRETIIDTLELLKKQEAVKPVRKDSVIVTACYNYDCQCGAPLLIGQPFCSDCGRRVKWDA